MSPLLTAILLAGLAGLSMPLGGLLARWEHISDARLRDGVLHAITAFGGGALLSAVALVLVPHGAEALSPLVALSLLAAGGLVFAWVDTTLNRIGGSGALLLAMVLDFLPEAMALGAMLVSQSSTAILLAVMIFLQNLPEGFAAFRDMWQRDRSALQVLMVFVGLAALGPFCAIAGLVWLADMPDVLGGIMIFAAGGILYLLFQDVAPKAHADRASWPALGGVAGFALGLAGELMLG
ncbi:ZIP family metal transporter [Phaeobacter italicus]|jgi:ZIP family zinc transporter|uniref:ZIP family metal transporter n=1 Tax=Phaeobacter italicus TaxID=481446 RepID=UPI000186F9D0|nr:zinc transporter [Phaeobacter italicus]EEB70256.1 ZIP zinc transporter family protein [Ruegeria sp. R11]MEC8015216.1 divalent cation transporter [Pseudomonadota bacterium]MCA0857413.1 divalent cation transporter [Phaeobacter italicus]MCI5100062.1 divalent cation transporter [Phaeobacter italicus]MEC8575725.1 divalent cation transporter [Pseudomonadota bacterium]